MIPAGVGHIDHYEDRRNVDSAGIDRTPLPLNLLSLIISHISEPGDLARACRTCRIFYYMCLPNLYSSVKLNSYDHVRYSPETARPEGCGMGSPFIMGLNALVTRPVAQYVRSFEVCGQYKELGADEQARVGRVADGGMMLNILVRTAIDRMPYLDTFSWNLNVKMLSIVWEALVAKQPLRSLTIQFPTDRLPAPVFTAPGMPNLTSLCVTDIDPLCYPDNIQTLLHESPNIEHLTMHWNPRMRRERESSTNLHMYFGRIYATNHRMKLRSIGMYNLYCLGHTGNFTGMYDPAYLESMTAIDATGGADDDANMSFVVAPPKNLSPMPKLHMMRGNKVSRQNCDRLRKMAPVRKYFLISGRELRENRTPTNSRGGSIASPGSNISDSHRGSLYEGPRSVGGTPQSQSEAKSSPGNPFTSAATTSSSSISTPDAPVIALGQDYMDNIFRFHGHSLTHLLLLPQWRLSQENIRHLARSCTNLQEVGFGVEDGSFETLQIVVPNLRKLRALRILDPPESWSNMETEHESVQAEDEWFEEKISDQTWQSGWETLRWLGLGAMVFELLSGERLGTDGAMSYDEDNRDEMEAEPNQRRRVARRPLFAVRDVDIWRMDHKSVMLLI